MHCKTALMKDQAEIFRFAQITTSTACTSGLELNMKVRFGRYQAPERVIKDEEICAQVRRVLVR